jgi:hypothetical protein
MNEEGHTFVTTVVQRSDSCYLKTHMEKFQLELITAVYDKRFQSSDLIDFDIFLFALHTRVSLCGTTQKTNKSELWNRLSYRSLPYI